MPQRSFQLTMTGVPYLMCTIVPTVIFGLILGQWGTNLIWGHVFGFGWFVAQSYYGAEHWRTAVNIGILAWPPLVLLALWLVSGIAWRSQSQRLRIGLCWGLALLSVPIVPARTVQHLYAGAPVPADFNLLWNAML